MSNELHAVAANTRFAKGAILVAIGASVLAVGLALGADTGASVAEGDQAGVQFGGPRAYATRAPGARGRALSRYGGSISTEATVMRALRWLKREQKPDGSWDTPPAAMTGWALLCFLAHGETPASENFGTTVEKGINYLIGSRDAAGGWPRAYQHAIATCAISEAYSMTDLPILQEAGRKAIDIIIKGQRATGGWGYGLTPNDEADDTSTMAWCAEALKVAKLGLIEADGMDACIERAIKAFKANAIPTGGFKYGGLSLGAAAAKENPGAGGLTAAGVLGMRLLGAAKEPEVRNGIIVMDPWTCKWDAASGTQVYYWYYATQAKFYVGGQTWDDWNKQFSRELVESQTVLKGAGADGKDIGFWDLSAADRKGISTGLVFDTTLCCLMLEVYYRYCPTYRPPEEIERDGTDVAR